MSATVQKRPGLKLTWKGRTLLVKDWAKELGVERRYIYWRIANGWTVERALTQPFLPKTKLSVADKKLRIQARNALNKAVEHGRLTRPEQCEHLGCQLAEVEAHHYLGYAPEHRLTVRWFCPKHHAQAEASEER